MTRVLVLRLGHRPTRDKRITTHVALTARGLGADGVVICGVEDIGITRSVDRVVEKWGGPFTISFCSSWKLTITRWIERGGEVIHLTMYGLPLLEALEKIRKSEKDKLIVVGAEKVPREVYELATYNVSVTHQPISEVSALGVFLDRYFDGHELLKEFEGHKVRMLRYRTEKKTFS